MDFRVKKSCPNCSQRFALPSSGESKIRIPLLLPCGHSICQYCLENVIKFSEPIECKVCNIEVNVPSSDLKKMVEDPNIFRSMFPVDLFCLGQLALPHVQNTIITSDNLGPNEYYIDVKSILNKVKSPVGQCMECHSTTMKMCSQCAVTLCEACFHKIHDSKFLVIRQHELKTIEPQLAPNTCSVHTGKSLDYYCVDCSKANCMDCMLIGDKMCMSHKSIPYKEKNIEIYKDLKKIDPSLDEIFRRLTKTAIDTGNMLKNNEDCCGEDTELDKITFECQNHFTKLYAMVQKHETEIMLQLQKLKHLDKESLLKVKKELDGSIMNIALLLNKNRFVLNTNENEISKLNLAGLLDAAQKALETPWYLSKGKGTTIKLSVDEEICDVISKYVHIEGEFEEGGCKLMATKDIGEDVTIPAAPKKVMFPPELPIDIREKSKPKPVNPPKEQQSYSSIIPSFRPRHGSTSSINSVGTDKSFGLSSFGQYYEESGNKTVHSVHPFNENRQQKPLYEGSQELVYISHIINPNNFYVQRSFNQGLVKELAKEFENAESNPQPFINNVNEGKLFLVYMETDRKWHRCQIMKIDKNNPEQPIYQFYCLDYGISDRVTIDKLRLLPDARMKSPPPLAMHCSLANCKPNTGVWTPDDSILMLKIIDNKQAVMFVRKVRQSTYECDLTTFETGVNIAHALVFHERARLINTQLPYPNIITMVDVPKLFINNHEYKPGSVHEVFITHIVNPDKFFVRKCNSEPEYHKLCEDMDQAYSLRVKSGTIYFPIIGMACAVNVDNTVTSDYRGEGAGAGVGAGGWRRGVVVEREGGRQRVRVMLPDSGDLLVVHVNMLRTIQQRFTVIKALAVECHLSDVTPLNRKWSSGSVALMTESRDQMHELHVGPGGGHPHNSIGVTLYYDSDDSGKICINTEMVANRFAVAIGMGAKPKVSGNPGSVKNMPIDKVKTNKRKEGRKSKVTILTRQNEESLKQVKAQEIEKASDVVDKGPLKLEVEVLSCQSPSVMFVSLAAQQKTMKGLFDELQVHYHNNRSSGREEWKVGDRCCSLCAESMTWRRALITELEGDRATLFFTDFANTEKASVSELRELAPEFLNISDAAIKCHLSGVIPAIDGEWPSLTKEYLNNLIQEYHRFFITKNGNIKENSLPVELWVYHITPGGALEPNKAEWRCLNENIISQGLGIRDRSVELPKDAQEAAEADDVNSFLNLTGSVKEWLNLNKLSDNIKYKGTASTPSCSHSEQPSTVMVNMSVDNNKNVSSQSFSGQTILITDWLPASPLSSKEFRALPTNIDNDGIIYLHDIAQGSVLKLIHNTMDIFKFDEVKTVHTEWSVGEPCIARFYLDDRFYRARVLEVDYNKSSCVIYYIDYGNEEPCEFKDLRKSVVLHDIPAQARKCVLANIRPKGEKWSLDTLDYIHKIIVEKECFVRVVDDAEDVSTVEVKIKGLWLHKSLVDSKKAVYIEGMEPEAEPVCDDGARSVDDGARSVDDDARGVDDDARGVDDDARGVDDDARGVDDGPDYIVEDVSDGFTNTRGLVDIHALENKDWNQLLEEDEASLVPNFFTFPMNNLGNIKDFRCNVENINQIDVFDITLIDDEHKQDYEKLFEELQAKANEMPDLNGIYENKACISLFPEDDRWYRASILQYSELKGLIKVKYVDFGNVEVRTVDKIKEINSDWMKLPPAAIPAKLFGIKVNPDIDLELALSNYRSTFLDKPFHAKLVESDNKFIYIELRHEVDGDLIYQHLIENGSFQKAIPSE